jgi:serine/threonine protein kinase
MAIESIFVFPPPGTFLAFLCAITVDMVFKKTKKTRSRRLKKRSTRRKGGAKIGEGRTSHVFQPPLKCQDVVDSEYNSDKYVSKLTDAKIAEKEMKIAEKLKHIDPNCDFIIYPLASCPLNLKQTNDEFIASEHTKLFGRKLDTLLISIYGGITLNTIVEYIYKNYKNEPDALPPTDYINAVWKSLATLSEFVPSLYDNGIIHNDIHNENMVFNQDDYKTRIIDFEFNDTKNMSPNAKRSEDKYQFMMCWIAIYDAFVLYYKPSSGHNCSPKRNIFTLDEYKACCETMKNIIFSLP